MNRRRVVVYRAVMDDDLTALRIAPATEAEKPVVGRLLQLYLHDFSEFADAAGPFGDVDGDGVFRYDRLDSYWTDADLEVLLFRVGDRLAGFALLNGWSASGAEVDRAIAEFFVLRKYRRIGLGTLAALRIVEDRRGTWEIAVAGYNRPAQRFWPSVVRSASGYACEEREGNGERWSGPIWRLIPE